MTDLPENDSLLLLRTMTVKAKGGKWAPHSVRIRVLRSALFNERPAKFAKRLGVSPQRLGNFENGWPLSIEIANKIRVIAPGITLDWLYHGDERAVPMEMLIRLRAEAEKPEYREP